MARVIEGWLLSNDGFNFRRNPSDGCGDMGIGVSGSRGEYFIEMWLWFFGCNWATGRLGEASENGKVARNSLETR